MLYPSARFFAAPARRRGRSERKRKPQPSEVADRGPIARNRGGDQAAMSTCNCALSETVIIKFHLDVKQFAGLIKEITRSFFDAQHRMQPRAIATGQGHAVAPYDFLRCTSNCARPQAAM